MKVLIVAASHGNELLGIKVYEKLLRTRSPLLEHVDFIIGNPRAYAAKKRYIDTDLNRSYDSSSTGYEHMRAAEIREYVSRTRPDIVLDMHTTNCVQPSCLIVTNLDGTEKRRFLRASSIEKILKVAPMADITSLGDHVIGYEISNQHVATEVDMVIADVARYVAGETGRSTKQLFDMQGKIYKSEIAESQVATLINFEPHELGFVPVLVGENSYKKQTDYLGFKTSLPEEITL